MLKILHFQLNSCFDSWNYLQNFFIFVPSNIKKEIAITLSITLWSTFNDNHNVFIIWHQYWMLMMVFLLKQMPWNCKKDVYVWTAAQMKEARANDNKLETNWLISCKRKILADILKVKERQWLGSWFIDLAK